MGPAPPSHQRTYATETNATVQRQQKILGHLIFSDEGLTLETSAKHHIPQAKNIPYQPFFDQIRHQREDCHVASNMTLENQSRMDVHKRLQRSSFLDPKSKIRIGCWDVRTNQAPGGGGGDTRVKFCWVCAADLSEPLPHYSLFCGQL